MDTMKTGRKLAAAGVFAMMMTAAPLASHAEVAGGVIGCDAPGDKQVGGAVLGALLGGVAGSNLARHDRGTGTLVGAAAGAATGSYVGCKMQKGDAARPATANARTRPAADRDEERDYADRREDADGDRFVPPGLAKKSHGMPPGQAKKYYGVGERMPADYVRERRHALDEPERYGLRYPPEGYRWVIVDHDAYLVRTRTGIVADVVRAILG
jgi:Ni/Co efflux regulator RcnB